MGQTQIKGSSTFAYLDNHSNSATTTTGRKRKDNNHYNQDALLTRPELYGLHSSLPPLLLDATVPKHHHERPDSGYMAPSYNKSMQLVNDLGYIDTTYYPSLAFEYNSLADGNTATHESCATTTAANAETTAKGLVLTFDDVLLASPDKRLHEVYLSGRSIYRLSPNVAMLTMIRKLDLSNNRLTSLPEAIGYMQNLEALSVTKNRIKSLPDTIGYLSNLLELDVSFNEIDHITPCIGYLSKLKTLSLAYNQITRLPTDVSGLVGLVSLDLSRNPLGVLPAEISKLAFLRRLRLEDCPFDGDLVYPLRHNPPSLVEICARTVIRKQVKIDHHPLQLPQHMVNYIKSAKPCTSCRGPYYESYVLRGRLMEKTDMHIPLEYTLCSAHWSDADDRILNMFCVQPDTSSQVVHLPNRPMLPCPPKQQKMERLTAFTHRPRRPSSTAATATNLSTDSMIETIVTEDCDARLAPAAKSPLKHQLTPTSLAKLTSKLKRTSLFW